MLHIHTKEFIFHFAHTHTQKHTSVLLLRLRYATVFSVASLFCVANANICFYLEIYEWRIYEKSAVTWCIQIPTE